MQDLQSQLRSVDPEPDGFNDSAVQRGLAEAARGGIPLREIEDRYIDEVLARCGGRKGEAAQKLGIDRKTLYRRELARLSREERRG